MKATVLADNIADGELLGEWGLCIYIEYNKGHFGRKPSKNQGFPVFYFRCDVKTMLKICPVLLLPMKA